MGIIYDKLFEETPDKTLYGLEFAKKVANHLKIFKAVFFGYHSDYCGTGFEYKENSFNFVKVDEGVYTTIVKKLNNEEEFIEWLSKQSDFTLGGFDKDSDLFEEDEFYRGNQRIDKKLLNKILEKYVE
jgi:hypothetical protein